MGTQLNYQELVKKVLQEYVDFFSKDSQYPLRPVFDDTRQSYLILMEGYPVEFLWVIPLTEAEIAHKLKYGFESLLDVFDEVNHPIILNPHRKSYL